ncbi:MAG: response regulator [Myxococcota bacterium]|nr:response regulator [Myxococcota bacterium]
MLDVNGSRMPLDGASNDAPESEARTMRVLVIDDEPLIGTTLRILLDDHDVEVVTSGRAAQEVLAEGSFDVILCDLMLDDLSGMDLSAWLDEARPDLTEHVIYMTGGAFTEDARRFLREVPKQRQLEKPFSASEIQAVLSQFA